MSRTLIKPLTKEKKELSLNGNCVFSLVSHSRGSPHLSVCIRVHPWPKNQTSKADRTPKKTSDLATDGHGYTRMRSASFLALHREKIGTKLYGYVLAKRYTSSHYQTLLGDETDPLIALSARARLIYAHRHVGRT